MVQRRSGKYKTASQCGSGSLRIQPVLRITPVMCYRLSMMQFQTKITSQGQVSVPAAIRSLLHLTPGSVLAWKEDTGRVSVERVTLHSTAEVHQALFGDLPAVTPVAAKTAQELKQGIRELIKRRHASH